MKTYDNGQTDEVDVGVGGLNGAIEGVLVVGKDLPVVQVPLDVRLRQRLDLALEVQLVALLARRRLAEEGGLDASWVPNQQGMAVLS